MTLLLSGVVGAAIALAAILGDAHSWYPHHYHGHPGGPQLFLWVFLIASQLALSTALLIPTAEIVRELFPRSSRQARKQIALYTSSVLVIVTAFVLTTTFFLAPNFAMPMGGLKARVLALNTVSLAVVLVGAVGGWLVQFALEDEFRPEDGKNLWRFAALRLQLNRLLWVVGAILGASIVAMAGLRNAVITFHGVASAFPWQYVFIYGAFFSALLALAYLPIHNRALKIGRSLRDQLLPKPDDGSWRSVTTWQTDRKALEDALSLDLSANASIRTVAAILTPLAGSLIGLLLRS